MDFGAEAIKTADYYYVSAARMAAYQSPLVRAWTAA